MFVKASSIFNIRAFLKPFSLTWVLFTNWSFLIGLWRLLWNHRTMAWVYLTKSIKSALYVREKKAIVFRASIFTTKNVNNLENFHSKASKKQVYLSSNIYKQYKTKIFDRKAEQWRTEQEISGKFKKYFHEFLPRPVTFNVLI